MLWKKEERRDWTSFGSTYPPLPDDLSTGGEVFLFNDAAGKGRMLLPAYECGNSVIMRYFTKGLRNQQRMEQVARGKNVNENWNKPSDLGSVYRDGRWQCVGERNPRPRQEIRLLSTRGLDTVRKQSCITGFPHRMCIALASQFICKQNTVYMGTQFDKNRRGIS